MDRVTWVEHKGKKMLVVSLQGMQTSKMPEVHQVLKSARTLIDAQPPKSLLLITDISQTNYNGEAVDAIRKYASANTPFVRASAIVGASTLHAIVINTLRILTHRDLRTFATLEQAKDYLATV